VASEYKEIKLLLVCVTLIIQKKPNHVQIKQEQAACVLQYQFNSYQKMMMDIFQSTGQKVIGVLC
jgi:hypothetical protein